MKTFKDKPRYSSIIFFILCTYVLFVLGNLAITHLKPEALRNKCICIDHFAKEYIKNATGQRVRLSKLAIPTSYKATETSSQESPVPSTSQESPEPSTSKGI